MAHHRHKYIISGGGTGGHIFPAIAIADALKDREPDADILFVGARGRMEMEKVPAAGYSIKGLWISGLQRKLSLKNLLFPCKVISSLFKAWRILRSFRPDVVIGTGGYASGPTLRVAAMLGIPTLIQEQNSCPGITNKVLAKRADRICVAFEGMEKFFPSAKIVVTGNPVRKDILRLNGKKKPAVEFFQLNPELPVLLVLGGSLGARTINESILQGLSNLKDQPLQLLWQTGRSFLPVATRHIRQHQISGVKVLDFISRMDLAYALADLIVSRAGAISISELCVVGKPVILVPSPNVTADHQTKNAAVLAGMGAAIMIPDKLAKEQLWNQCMAIMNNPAISTKLASGIASLGRPDATGQIVNQVLSLIKPKTQ
ncbi:MAG TPA: undecaprenyldiphospho-muramoylpentapeptide beta-N-acetylglucosaminyltransferase [Bacteroidales bacterium]|nr:undecaprenyldiphospho-muramoylpentapeptide beta-N-acetylglucosaminyltransferase [Bacteroidales bacterium]HSA44386.1 undecaprenyldiphospho-muramoylpentapeptide beta-N-acetylglucosaminyltransferase [Bacteroidales bacterium]